MPEDKEGQVSGGTEPEGSDADDSDQLRDAFSEAQKQINQLKKEIAGLDKKNEELLKEKEEREKEEVKKQRQKDMSPKELEAFLAKESADALAEANERAKSAETELDNLKKEYERKRILYQKVNQKGNIPNIIRRLLIEDRPDDPDELGEYIDELIRQYETDQIMSSNRLKTGVRPKTGDIVKTEIPTDRDWNSLSQVEKDQIARSVSKEKLIDQLKKDAEK